MASGIHAGAVAQEFSCGSIHYVDAYRDWTILRHDEGLISCAQDGTLHVHSVETVVARRG